MKKSRSQKRKLIFFSFQKRKGGGVQLLCKFNVNVVIYSDQKSFFVSYFVYLSSGMLNQYRKKIDKVKKKKKKNYFWLQGEFYKEFYITKLPPILKIKIWGEYYL